MNEEEKIELRSEEFQEILGGVPHCILRWGITVLAIIVVILLTGSAVFKYPDIISAPVVLTGTTPPATVVAHASGKLKELYVSDKQQVNAGDYLAVIDNPATTQDVLDLEEYLNCLDISNDSLLYLPKREFRVGNLQSIYSTFYTVLFDFMEYRRLSYYPQKIEMTRERIIQYEEQYRNLLRQQKLINEQLILSQKQFSRDSLLHSGGVISQEEFEESQNIYLQSNLSCENMYSSLNNMRIQIAQLKESLLDTDHQNIEKYNGLHTQLQSLISQVKTEIQSWELNYVLKTPINGKITFTNYWRMNQNVSAGEDIFTIIPNSGFPVIGRASLPVVRSGKVETGQKVNIRLANFPENEYGILNGTVRNISLAPAQSGESTYYMVEISLSNELITTYKKELPYLPNMQGQADIITDDISLLERFVLPLKKIISEN
jgi:HlyD family secretion protein